MIADFSGMIEKDFEDMKFNVEKAERVLQSNGFVASDALKDSFDWGATDFWAWSAECYYLNLGNTLSNEARTILEGWIKQYRKLKEND